MDPQAAWQTMLDAHRHEDWETVADAADALLDWLTRGGFIPRLRLVIDMPPHRQRLAVARVCRRFLRQARRHGSSL